MIEIDNSQQSYDDDSSTDFVNTTQLPPVPSRQPTIQGKPRWSKLTMIKQAIVWMAGSDAVIITGIVNGWHVGWYALWLIVMTALMIAIQFIAIKLNSLSTFLRKKLTRPPDVNHPVTTPDEEECYYYEDPHLTMFVNRVVLQVILWIATLVGGWFILQEYSSFWLNIMAQYVISQVNLYFIVRGYLIWDGIDHKITRDNYIRTQTEDLFFLIRRDPILSVSKQTLVNAQRDKRTLTEYWPFRERGTIVITEQDQRKKPRRIGFIKYPNRFVAAINAR